MPNIKKLQVDWPDGLKLRAEPEPTNAVWTGIKVPHRTVVEAIGDVHRYDERFSFQEVRTPDGRRGYLTYRDGDTVYLKPATVELSLQAVEQTKQERRRVTKLRRQRLERAKYEADRAARQYHAVEPENRLVARPLERKWNESLRHVEELKQQVRERQQNVQDRLSEIEEKDILYFAHDLPAIWNASSTSNRNRKRLLQSAIKEVQLKNSIRGRTKLSFCIFRKRPP